MGAVTHYNEAAVYLRAQGLAVTWKKATGLTVTLPCHICGVATGQHSEYCSKGISDTLRGEVKYRADLPRWPWACPACGGHGNIYDYSANDDLSQQCPTCKGSGRRGKQAKPRDDWWRILAGVRCPNIVDGKHLTARDVGLPTWECDLCHGTGYVQHPHDFLMMKRIANAGEAAYEWLVLVKMNDVLCNGLMPPPIERVLVHPTKLITHDLICIYPAADWARAVKEQ